MILHKKRRQGLYVKDDEKKGYDYTIVMERLGQILWSIQGSPEMVSNKKKEIFTNRYEDLFGKEDLISEKTIELIKSYSKIKKDYKSTRYIFSEQKCMYVLYIAYFTKNKNYESIISVLEEEIDRFITDSGLKLSQARALISSKFKKIIDDRFSISVE